MKLKIHLKNKKKNSNEKNQKMKKGRDGERNKTGRVQ